MCEGAQKANAPPTDSGLSTSVKWGHLRVEHGIERWSEVFNGEDQLALARLGQLDCYRFSRALCITMTDDVRNGLLQAQLDGELKFVIGTFMPSEAPHPLGEASSL